MSINIGLRVLSSEGGFTNWFVATTDAPATVIASGYFNAAAAKLRRRDRIFVLASTGTTPIFLNLSVSSADGAVPVTVEAAPVATALTAAGSGATAGAYATAAIRDERDTRINLITTTLIAAGLMRAP